MAITVTAIVPNSGVQGMTVTCDVSGTGFEDGWTVKLKRSVLEIQGTNVQVLTGNLLRVDFVIPLNMLAQIYAVIVTSSDGSDFGQLSNAFMIRRHGTRGYVHPRRVHILAFDEEEFWKDGVAVVQEVW